MAPRSFSLSELLQGLAEPVPELRVTGRLCLDSRALAAGDLFVALRGEHHDGRRYLADAAAAGAVAALVEDALPESTPPLPAVVVPELRQRVGEIAARYYDHPSRRMHLAAVTGTNGKTTVSQLFAQLVRAAGYDCGVIGTLGASLDATASDTIHTTPDPVSLQETLATWGTQAVPFASMEASSHALDQGRLNGLDIDVAIFTNLTRDHLDYHGDMRSYGDAKSRLFQFSTLRAAVLNADDAFSETLRAQIPASTKVLRYGLTAAEVDVRCQRLESSADGLKLRVETPWGSATFRCPLLGRFNAANLLAALTAALQAGLPFDTLISALERAEAVPGRMEALRQRGAPLVVIDYAHTPDALTQVLRALREQCQGRLIVVFGCGGDRDQGKRELMARAVSELADAAVITSDNPRGEDPRAIIADVEAGMSIEYQACVDRGEAIGRAIRDAQRDDCVLIAGKGHEDYQIIGSQRLVFSDSVAAQEALERLAA